MARLILCGGGHVALEVACMASRLEFEVIVLDDREEFANRERFPMARQVLCMPFLQALKQLGSRPSDFFVILTRGHVCDRDCLAQVLQGRYAYVGMIGSRTKVAAIRESLLADGVPAAVLDQVHAPIGLPLGGQSPAEVAVSICAQLVQERVKLGPNLVPPPEEPGVLCTIVKKSGSAPRGVGTWMHVRPDGTCVGTIGGGMVEHQATLDALQLWESGADETCRRYDLTPHAAELGMVCGGIVEVSFQAKRS